MFHFMQMNVLLGNSYARMLIEVDITLPLPDKVLVEGPDGKGFELPISFEWKPSL